MYFNTTQNSITTGLDSRSEGAQEQHEQRCSLLAACRSASEPIGTPPTPWLPSADSAPGASISGLTTAPHSVLRVDRAHKLTQSGGISAAQSHMHCRRNKGCARNSITMYLLRHTPLQAETDSCSCVSSVKQHSSAFKQDKSASGKREEITFC